jgi:putative salt-induced outer membrane protein YdiY
MTLQRAWALACVLAVASVQPLLAADTAVVGATPVEKPAEVSTALPDLSWVPPDDSFDWVQLKSGEWLKGQIKAMQDRELEFESEELDVQILEWKDTRQVRSGTGHVIEIKFVDGTLLSGRIYITPTTVTVESSGTSNESQPRDRIQSFTRSGTRERQFWSGNVSLGLTARGGNTQQVDYTGQAHLQRRTPDTRLKVDYIGNRSEADKVENANNHRLSSELDMWQSQHFYWVLPFAEYYTDPFQNISHRVTLGVGAGYDIVARRDVEWTISIGPGYQQTHFVSAQPGEPIDKGAAAVAFASHFNWEISDPFELTMDYRGQFTSREVDETTHHAVASLSIEVTKRFDIDLSFVWDRISNPKVGSDGVKPEPDDYRLVIGVSLNL